MNKKPCTAGLFCFNGTGFVFLYPMNERKESFTERLDRLIRQYRVAILGTLVVHAFFLLCLVVFQISVSESPLKDDIIFFDFSEELQLPEEKLPEEMQGYEQDNSDLKNISVNEADKNRSSDDYYKEFQEIVNQTKGKPVYQAENYDDKRWLIKDHSKEFEYREEDQSEQEQNNKISKQGSGTYSGKTIISYFLDGRKATRLPVPSYQCLSSGEVIVDILVNKDGKVISAVIRSSSTPTGETCLPEAARSAATRSRFSIDLNAPAQQKGYITYKFVAQ